MTDKVKRKKATKPKKKKSKGRRKSTKKSGLPSKLFIKGEYYRTPSKLTNIRFKGARINNDVKGVVYQIYLELNKKYTLQNIVNTLYDVRNRYAFNSGNYKPSGILAVTCFRYMGIDSDYAFRSDIKDKMISVHRMYKNIQNYRFECFECDKHVFLKFVPAIVEVDRELNFFWEARELYLERHSSDTFMFGIWYFFEPLTRFAYVNFNDIVVDGGDLNSFKDLLRDVKDNFNSKQI